MDDTPGFDVRLRDAAFWRSLCPSLTIGWPAADPDPLRPGEDLRAVHEQFRSSGYFELKGVFPVQATEMLREAVETLVAAGFPPVCVFLYDQPWHLLHAASAKLALAFGGPFLVLSNFWAWLVPNDGRTAGFGVHRDFYDPFIGPSGASLTANLWIALSEAQPPGSCLYFLPAEHDPNYPGDLRRTEVDRLQDLVAVPARAGDVVGVGANVLHWGSRGSSRAAGARISLALQIQSPVLPPLGSAAWMTWHVPAFRDRLSLVAEQIGLFEHHYRSVGGLRSLARALADTPSGPPWP